MWNSASACCSSAQIIADQRRPPIHYFNIYFVISAPNRRLESLFRVIVLFAAGRCGYRFRQCPLKAHFLMGKCCPSTRITPPSFLIFNRALCEAGMRLASVWLGERGRDTFPGDKIRISLAFIHFHFIIGGIMACNELKMRPDAHFPSMAARA